MRAAINAGFSRVFLTLVDTHVAGFIAAAFLFQFGTGPDSWICGDVVGRLDVEPVHLDVRVEDAVRAGVAQTAPGRDTFHLAMHIFKNPNFNFLRWRWHALALSAAVIVAGVAMMATRGIPLGVEFAGGTIVIVRFEQPRLGGRAGPRRGGPERGSSSSTAIRRATDADPVAADRTGRAGRESLGLRAGRQGAGGAPGCRNRRSGRQHRDRRPGRRRRAAQKGHLTRRCCRCSALRPGWRSASGSASRSDRSSRRSTMCSSRCRFSCSSATRCRSTSSPPC